MSSKLRQGAVMLIGVSVLSVVAAIGGNAPSIAADPPPTVAALEFEPTDYPQCKVGSSNRTIRSMVNTIVANSPVGFDKDGDPTDEDAPLYRQPLSQERDIFRIGLRALIQDDSQTATSWLGEVGYQVCSGAVDSTATRVQVLVYPQSGMSAATTEGQPALVLTPGMADTATIFSGPHLTGELRIKDQLLHAVGQTSLGYVRAAVFSGTDRCNRLALAPPQYQGNTSECGGSYRISDMAHNIDTIFQAMHDVLRLAYPDSYNVQPHGMSAVGFSMSRGNTPSQGSATHPDDPIARAHAHTAEWLQDLLAIGGITAEEQPHYDNLTSCTPYVHSGTGLPAATRNLHCGTRNAQLDRERTFGAGDKFIHYEQSLFLRNNYPDSILQVAYALHDD